MFTLMDIKFKKTQTYYIMKCGEVFFFYEFEFISKLFGAIPHCYHVIICLTYLWFIC